MANRKGSSGMLNFVTEKIQWISPIPLAEVSHPSYISNKMQMSEI